jgi:hypothetical protein
MLPELEKNPLLNVRNIKSASAPWIKLKEAKSRAYSKTTRYRNWRKFIDTA